MWQIPERTRLRVLITAALLVFAAAGLGGGPDFSRDVEAVHWLARERADHIGLTWHAIALTTLGGAPALLLILLVAVMLLARERRWRDTVSLTAIVIGGRIAVELLKLAINRPRPQFGPYPVEIASLSFPSGHAANSMITFLALALIVVPGRIHSIAIGGAIAMSLAVGATRPLLGVHWPSDVIGGWAFGVGWVIALVASSRRWRNSAK